MWHFALKAPPAGECLHGAGPVAGKRQDGNADKSCGQKTWRKKKLLCWPLTFYFVPLWYLNICVILYIVVFICSFFFFFDLAKPSFSSSIVEIKAVCCAPPYFQFCHQPQLAHPSSPAFKNANLLPRSIRDNSPLFIPQFILCADEAAWTRCSRINDAGTKTLQNELIIFQMSHRGSGVELFEDRILLWSRSQALTERHTCSWCEDSSVFFCSKVCRKKKSYVTMGEVLSILPLPGETSTLTARVAALDLRHLWGRWLTALMSCRFSKLFFTDTQEAAALHAGQSAGETVDQPQARTA